MHIHLLKLEREKQILYITIYMWNLKKIGIGDLIYKANIETEVQRKKTFDFQGKKGDGMKWETATDTYALLVQNR